MKTSSERPIKAGGVYSSRSMHRPTVIVVLFPALFAMLPSPSHAASRTRPVPGCAAAGRSAGEMFLAAPCPGHNPMRLEKRRDERSAQRDEQWYDVRPGNVSEAPGGGCTPGDAGASSFLHHVTARGLRAPPVR